MVSLPRGRVVGGEQRARLQADGGVAAELEGLLDDEVGLGEGRVDGAGVDGLAEGEVVAELGMQHGRLGIERGGLVGDGRQLLPFNLDELGGVLGLGAGAGDDHGDRLADPAGAIHRQRILRRRLHAGEAGQRADPGAGDELGQLGAGHDEGDARLAPGLARVDGEDLGVGERAAQECGMQHARQREIVGIAAAAGHRALGAGSRQRAADVAVRPVERGAEDFVGHSCLPPRQRCSSRLVSVVSMASTMAWKPVQRQKLPDRKVRISSRLFGALLRQQLGRRHQHAGRTEAALQGVA